MVNWLPLWPNRSEDPSIMVATRLGEKELLVSKYITTPICFAATSEAECRQTCNGIHGIDNSMLMLAHDISRTITPSGIDCRNSNSFSHLCFTWRWWSRNLCQLSLAQATSKKCVNAATEGAYRSLQCPMQTLLHGNRNHPDRYKKKLWKQWIWIERARLCSRQDYPSSPVERKCLFSVTSLSNSTPLQNCPHRSLVEDWSWVIIASSCM